MLHLIPRALRSCVLAPLVLMLLLPGRGAAQESVFSKQDLNRLQVLEDSLILVADSMQHSPLPEDREQFSQTFARMLVRALKVPNSFQYPFKKLDSVVNVTPAPDGAFRIFNWVIAPSELTRRYYGAIQLPGEGLKLYGLVDYSGELGKGAEDSVLSGGKWLGALYYRIMPTEIQGQKCYLLFGLNSSNYSSTRKIIDPLFLTPKGPVFGGPAFAVASSLVPNQRINRFIIEFKKGAQVNLNWSEEYKAIIFDKLESEMNDPNRKYTLVPSGQYDALQYTGQDWRYVPNIRQILELKDGELPQGGRE